MNCIPPPAPAGETAAGLYADSRAAIAATRRGSTPCCFDASAISDERYAGIGVVTVALELKSAAPNGVKRNAVRIDRSEKSDSRISPKKWYAVMPWRSLRITTLPV